MSGNPENQKGRNDSTGADTIKEGGKTGSYDVGYCRPPEKYRFRPGESGNPLGRPKRSNPLSFAPELADELYRSIPENDKITNKQDITKTVVAAARKNAKQGMALMEHCAKLGHHEVDVGAADDDAFIERLVTGKDPQSAEVISSSARHQDQETQNDQ